MAMLGFSPALQPNVYLNFQQPMVAEKRLSEISDKMAAGSIDPHDKRLDIPDREISQKQNGVRSNESQNKRLPPPLEPMPRPLPKKMTQGGKIRVTHYKKFKSMVEVRQEYERKKRSVTPLSPVISYVKPGSSMLTGRPNIHEPLIMIDEVDAEIGSQEGKFESSNPKGRPLEPIDMKNEDLSPNVLKENFDFAANVTTQTNNILINNDKQLKSMIRARDVEIRRLTTLAREINQKLVLQMGYNDKIRDSKDAIIQKLEIKVTELQAFHSAIKSTFQPYEVLSLPVMMDKIKQFMELSVKMWPQGL